MSTDLIISNAALSKLGEAAISSLSDNNKAARAMNARFTRMRDIELEAHPWRFAVKRANLTAEAGTPPWGFSKIYNRPDDDLRPLMINGLEAVMGRIGLTHVAGHPGSLPYEFILNQIHTNMGEPLEYEYISRAVTIAAWPASFQEALACRLAMDACEELTQSAQKFQIAAGMYQRAVDEAKRANQLWVPPRKRIIGTWLTARINSPW